MEERGGRRDEEEERGSFAYKRVNVVTGSYAFDELRGAECAIRRFIPHPSPAESTIETRDTFFMVVSISMYFLSDFHHKFVRNPNS